MPYAVQAVLKEFEDDLSEGDDIILNDPYRGGTHLPDITMVSPIFFKDRLVGFAANRAHHSDVGGVAPGSMSALSRDVNQEGIRIPPVKLWSKGKPNRQILDAVDSVTLSAVYYVVRCVTDPSIPANAGCFKPIEVKAPSGTIVNAEPPAPVAGGNVETSTRIVDVTLKAFSSIIPERVCAACQGTMNNVTIGGVDPRNGKYFTYYETIAGGFGARPNKDGVDGIHSHMTNTLNTPVEALESAYPLRIRRYELVRGSGGRGRSRGGLGIRRDTEVLAEGSTISLMGERQRRGPYGLIGGKYGSPGGYGIVRRNRIKSLYCKAKLSANSGDVLTVTTPGGGGYGTISRRSRERIEQDRADGKA